MNERNQLDGYLSGYMDKEALNVSSMGRMAAKGKRLPGQMKNYATTKGGRMKDMIMNLFKRSGKTSSPLGTPGSTLHGPPKPSQNAGARWAESVESDFRQPRGREVLNWVREAMGVGKTPAPAVARGRRPGLSPESAGAPDTNSILDRVKAFLKDNKTTAAGVGGVGVGAGGAIGIDQLRRSLSQD